MKRNLFAVAILIVACLAKTDATILHVPANYATIQSAINASSNGDTVLVAAGTYFENLNFRGKNILLSSNFLFTGDPADIIATVINGSTPAYADTASCVIMNSGEDSTCVLQGFTLTGGKGSRWHDEHIGGLYREGGAVLTEGSSPTIQHNRIIANSATNLTAVVSAGGGGLRCDGGNPRILNNLIAYNTGRYGAGIVLNYTGATIKNNIIVHNSGGEDYGGGGIWSYQNGPFPKVIENNTIANNASTSNGGGLLVWSTSVVVRNNIIWANMAPIGPQISLQGGAVTVSYSDVQGGWTGTSNINLNPQFVDTVYLLSKNSPCIDAGDTSASLQDPEDMFNAGSAEWPSRAGLRNDQGATGGPLRKNYCFDPRARNSPALLYPAEGALLPLTSIPVRWASVFGDPGYHVQFGTDSTFQAGLLLDSTSVVDTVLTLNGLTPLATYYLRVRANQVVTDGWSSFRRFTVDLQAFTFPVAQRWNLVSVPIAVGDYSSSALFPSAIEPLYSFDGTGYSANDALRNGQGYWTKFSTDDTLLFRGSPIGADTFNVFAGWNLLGSVNGVVATNALTTVPSGIIESNLYGYNNGYSITDSLYPARGYWVKANQPGQIIINAQSASASMLKLHAVPTQAGKLIFTDADGNSQTLYILDEKSSIGDLGKFELPPPSPSGILDVRFSSGGMVECLHDNDLSDVRVRISGGTFPVNLRWEKEQTSKNIVMQTTDRKISLEDASTVSLHHGETELLFAAGESSEHPAEFALDQNYPNPFNPSTTIQFTLPTSGLVTLKIYNLLGREVVSLLDREAMDEGTEEVDFDASGFSSGVYFYRLTIEGVSDEDGTPLGQSFVAVKKMLLMK